MSAPIVRLTPKNREKAQRLFGSEENYLWWRELNKEELENILQAPWEYQSIKYEEDYTEKEGAIVPFWVSSGFVLREAPLGALGIPEGYSDEFEEYEHRVNSDDWYQAFWRQKRLPRRDGRKTEAHWRDYSKMGWSPDDGVPIRLVTPEEDAEFERRLRANGLARANSKVPVVGYRLDEMLRAELPEPEWIINKMLRASGAMMLYGPSGIGKSWMTYTLLLMMATGKGYALKDDAGNTMLAAGQHDGKRVCLVDGEMLASDIAARISALIKGMGLKPVAGEQSVTPINPEELREALVIQAEAEEAIASMCPELGHSVSRDARDTEDAIASFNANWARHNAGFGFAEGGVEVNLGNVFVYPRTAQDYRASMVSLVDEGSKAPIIEFAIENKIDVMLFDNLATLSDGLADENDAAAFQALNNLVVALKRVGVATVLVHHTGKQKDAKTYRGSSNLNTVLEGTVRLEAVEGPKDGARFRLVVDKNRNGEDLEADGKTMVLREGRWVFEEDAHENAQVVIEAIKTRRYPTQKDVGDALRLSQPTVSKAIQIGVTKGYAKEVEVKLWFKEARELAKENPEEIPAFDQMPETGRVVS
jgi:hypothetical protein